MPGCGATAPHAPSSMEASTLITTRWPAWHAWHHTPPPPSLTLAGLPATTKEQTSGAESCGVVRSGAVWCGVVRCNMVVRCCTALWCGVVRCGTVWCYMVVWSGLVLCGLVVRCGAVWRGGAVWFTRQSRLPGGTPCRLSLRPPCWPCQWAHAGCGPGC